MAQDIGSTVAARDQRRLAAAASLATPLVLASVSAFVDVVCFLGLFNTFTAFITGNIIVLSAEIVRNDSGILTKLLVLPAFAVTATLWVALIKWMRRDGAVVFHYLILFEALFLAAFMIAGAALSPLPGGDAWQTMFVALFAVIAMSLQNAMMVMVLSFHMPTTLMTGNLTKLIIHGLDAASAFREHADGLAAPAAPKRADLLRYLAVLAVFFAGAGLGAVGFWQLGFLVLALPVTILAALGWRIAGS